MMVMIMSTLMAGQRPTMLTGELGGEHVFAAFNIEAFTDLDEFKDNMDGTLKALREAEPAAGHDRVFYAGLSEYEEEQDRRANGHPPPPRSRRMVRRPSRRTGNPKARTEGVKSTSACIDPL